MNNALLSKEQHGELIEHSAVSIQCSHKILVDYNVKQSTQLLTGEGEEVWIEGWKSRALKGNGFNTGDVFVGVGDLNRSTYVVLDYDEDNGHILYSRVLPYHSGGTVEINITEKGTQSEVEVIYSMTSLSEAGAADLEKMTDEAFINYLSPWAQWIADNKTNVDSWLAKHNA